MKRWLRLTLQLLSLVLFGLILWLGGPGAWQHILAGDPEDVIPSFLLSGLAGMLAATRLRLIAISVAGRELASWRRFYYLNMTARAVGLVMPRSLSTLAGKPVALQALGVPLKRSVWTVVMDSLFDLSLLAVLTVPALLFLKGNISIGIFSTMGLGLILALVGGLWWIMAAGRLLPFVRWLGRITWLASALRLNPANAADGSTELAAVALLPRSTALRALGLSVLLNITLATRFYYIARAVGLVYPWSLFAAGFPATQLSLVVAVTPGGLGLFDAGWYGVLMLGGVLHQEALNFVVAQRAYIFIFVLAWAGFSTLLSLTVERGQWRGR